MKLRRKPVILFLLITVLSPIVLYTDKLGNIRSSPSGDKFIDDFSTFTISGEIRPLNLLPQEIPMTLKEPLGVVYSANSSQSLDDSGDSVDNSHKSRQLAEESVNASLSTGSKENVDEDPIRLVTDKADHSDDISLRPEITADKQGRRERSQLREYESLKIANETSKVQPKIMGSIRKDDTKTGKQNEHTVYQDARVRHLRDQLIRGRIYLSLAATRNNPHFIRELRLRMKEVQRVLGDSNMDSELPRKGQRVDDKVETFIEYFLLPVYNLIVHEKLKQMEQTLVKGKQIQDDCAIVVKKLRAIIHSTEDQLRVHKKQTLFLTQLTAKTVPKGLHCLPLRLSTEYFALISSKRNFPNQEKLLDPKLYHYALFSDNILATAVVVNSTISNAKNPSDHVFHIVTDSLNYAAMRMWFLSNPPGKATIQVQNIEEFTWLNSSYSPVLKQLGSPSMKDYYFRARRGDSSDSNLKFRNPKYLSIINHLRFYLPEIFPELNKVLFLDDDIVVQKDLSKLWSLDMKGKVNGAVETCGETFHRFDRYLNFSNPLISENFDPHACGWAFGMNMFDLTEWRRQNITQVYHSWQALNHNRQLWKLGTLPPGLITFWNRTYTLDRSWHVLGLGYNPNVSQKELERAAVLHYNGNMKPWLEIGIPKYRSYWTKFADYGQIYLRECNINP